MIRGFQDIFNDKAELFDLICDRASSLLKQANYRRIHFPVVEQTSLFKRSVASSDIVNKELYSFLDKSNRELSLIPEGTAPVARAVLEHSLAPAKLFYISPFFRYERPQKGRYRQFHQIGLELIGESGLYADLDVLMLAKSLLDEFDIKAQTKVNYLGSHETREKYKKYLKETFKKRDLCEDCLVRIEKNVLRILDCKNCKIDFVESLQSFLSKEEREYFSELCAMLKTKMDFSLSNIVRGLDYYTGLVFEMDQELTLIGGGRYDNLYKELGDRDFPAIGFACGIERLLELITLKEQKIDIYIVYIDTMKESFEIFNMLRSKMRVDMSLTETSMKRQLTIAGKVASKALIVGKAEVESREYILKDLSTGEQKIVSLEELMR